MDVQNGTKGVITSYNVEYKWGKPKLIVTSFEKQNDIKKTYFMQLILQSWNKCSQLYANSQIFDPIP